MAVKRHSAIETEILLCIFYFNIGYIVFGSRELSKYCVNSLQISPFHNRTLHILYQPQRQRTKAKPSALFYNQLPDPI